ncbi:ANK1 [Symbiodinium sp. CCMP2456]|nr:ANK1 [Symbiodinium sp. CCMP2456]
MADDLHVWWASGEKVAVVSRDLRDVVSLKQQLHWLTGYPRFWQRLLHHNNVLEDSDNLESIVGDVQLVVLHDFARSSDEEIGALALAAQRGHATAIEEMPQCRNPANLTTL